MDKKGSRFSGKRILVTGASNGIGKGIAEGLVAEGANVINFDLKKVDMPGVTTIQVDLSDWDATRKCLKDIGSVDMLVNNAGIAHPPADFVDTEKAILDKVLATDLMAPFNIGQYVAKDMIDRGKGGSIVNVSSIAAFCTASQYSPYYIAKAGMQMMTKCMALELGPHNIRVNTINPGIVIDTGIGQEHWSDERKAAGPKSRTPLGRFTTVKEVVGAVLYLLSDDSSMTTGSALIIDGGYLCS